MLEFPFPPNQLNPNIKIHFRKKAEIAANYKWVCFQIAKKQPKPVFTSGNIHLFVTCYPPNKNRRDADNFLGSCKMLVDAIADYWGIDDRRFNPVTVSISEQVPDGKVSIRAMQDEKFVTLATPKFI